MCEGNALPIWIFPGMLWLERQKGSLFRHFSHLINTHSDNKTFNLNPYFIHFFQFPHFSKSSVAEISFPLVLFKMRISFYFTHWSQYNNEHRTLDDAAKGNLLSFFRK